MIAVLAVLKLHWGLERNVTATSSGVTEMTASGVDVVFLILRHWMVKSGFMREHMRIPDANSKYEATCSSKERPN